MRTRQRPSPGCTKLKIGASLTTSTAGYFGFFHRWRDVGSGVQSGGSGPSARFGLTGTAPPGRPTRALVAKLFCSHKTFPTVQKQRQPLGLLPRDGPVRVLCVGVPLVTLPAPSSPNAPEPWWSHVCATAGYGAVVEHQASSESKATSTLITSSRARALRQNKVVCADGTTAPHKNTACVSRTRLLIQSQGSIPQPREEWTSGRLTFGFAEGCAAPRPRPWPLRGGAPSGSGAVGEGLCARATCTFLGSGGGCCVFGGLRGRSSIMRRRCGWRRCLGLVRGLLGVDRFCTRTPCRGEG